MGTQLIREFCAENFENVPAAIAAGAARIELCDNLAVGGTTPSAGVIEAAVAYAHAHGARVMSMIRPRGGDFVCSEAELAIMERDIEVALGFGTDGIVLGCLVDAGGAFGLDVAAIERLVGRAHACASGREEPLDVTFHMAFDALPAARQEDAIDTLVRLGATRILTHGGPAGTPIDANLERLRELIAYAAGRIIILPGAGITYANAERIARALGVREVHGTKIVDIASADGRA